jgi:HlyD family secretion protein
LVPAGRRELGSPLPPFAPDPMLNAPAPRTRAPMVFGLVIFLVFVVGFGAWSVLAPLAEAAIVLASWICLISRQLVFTARFLG